MCQEAFLLLGVFRSTRRSTHISEPRINDRIRVPEVRLVGPNGEQVGIVRVEDALRLAAEADLDLVEVAPQARPPVAKLMDFGKFKYEAAMKARESRKNQVNTIIKEIKLRPKIDKHDYGTKKGHVERFLKGGDKVKVTIMFRGREQAHPERGRDLLNRLYEDLGEIAANLLGLLAFEQLVKVRVAIEMVEILEQGKVVHLLEVRIGLVTRKPCGEVHRNLLVAESHLDRALIPWNEPVDRFLLLGLDAAQEGKLLLYVGIERIPRHLVREHDGFDLDAVHEDAARAAVGMHLFLAIGLHVELSPVPELILERYSFLVERVECHRLPPVCVACRSMLSLVRKSIWTVTQPVPAAVVTGVLNRRAITFGCHESRA